MVGPECYAQAVKRVGRNDPCPCGSGTKYKKCCMGRVDAKKARLPILVGIVGVSAGAGVGLLVDWTYGIGAIASGLIIAAAVAVFQDPPPPRQGGNPAGTDFGK